MFKKLFITSIGLFLIVLFLWGIYALLFSGINKGGEAGDDNPADDKPLDLSTGNTTKKTPVEAITESAVLSPALSADGSHIIYFEKSSGYIWTVDPETKQRSLVLDKNVGSPIAAVWPANKINPILKTQGTNGPQYLYYDIRASDPMRLKSGIQYLVWDSLSEKIIYHYKDSSGKGSIDIANPNGLNWRTLSAINAERLILAPVPKSPYISLWETPKNTRQTKLFTINITGGEPALIFSGKFGSDYLWSPNGEKLLVSFALEKNGSQTSIAVMNKYGGQFNTLNNPTLVSKCVWSKDNENVFCALPTSIPPNSVMPDDYMSGRIHTTDTFWKIDTKTGKSNRVIDLDTILNSYDASELFLSINEDLLFFINKKDGLLYKITL